MVGLRRRQIELGEHFRGPNFVVTVHPSDLAHLLQVRAHRICLIRGRRGDGLGEFGTNASASRPGLVCLGLAECGRRLVLWDQARIGIGERRQQLRDRVGGHQFVWEGRHQLVERNHAVRPSARQQFRQHRVHVPHQNGELLAEGAPVKALGPLVLFALAPRLSFGI
ncbi:MAG: hypothetical protein ACOC9P_01240 [bacterium]